MPVAKLREFLDANHIPYTTITHSAPVRVNSWKIDCVMERSLPDRPDGRPDSRLPDEHRPPKNPA